MSSTQLIDLDEAKRNRERIEEFHQLESKGTNSPPLILQPEVESPPKRKHKPGRQRTGEYRNCVDCGQEIYVKPSRLQKGKRCKPCANKFLATYANNPRGHYTRVKNLINQVILLYLQGSGSKQIANQLPIARNTVRKIISEHTENHLKEPLIS